MSRTWKTVPWRIRKAQAKHWFKETCPEGSNCSYCSGGSRGARLDRYGKELDKDTAKESE